MFFFVNISHLDLMEISWLNLKQHLTMQVWKMSFPSVKSPFAVPFLKHLGCRLFHLRWSVISREWTCSKLVNFSRYYCWCFRNPAPVGMSFIPFLPGFTHPGGCLGFLPSTVVSSKSWPRGGSSVNCFLHGLQQRLYKMARKMMRALWLFRLEGTWRIIPLRK